MTVFLVLVLLSGVAFGGYHLYRNRPAGSIESGITSFRREMRALAPPPAGSGRDGAPRRRRPGTGLTSEPPPPRPPGERHGGSAGRPDAG